MTHVVERVWGWVRPVVTYRPWGNVSSAVSDHAIMRDKQHVTEEEQGTGSWGLEGLRSWVWGAFSRKKRDQTMEEYWEAEEKLQPLDTKDLGLEKQQETETNDAKHIPPRWWNRMLPTSNFLWPRGGISTTSGLRQRKCAGWNAGGWDTDRDGEFSDYETPPPSPMPPAAARQPFLFRLFARSWKGEIVPEHYEICFNFIRHLFDLFVVGFLWTVSPPTKLVLEVLGVQGALKLWLHGMAMFLVSAVGMAGLLMLVQEYLLQFALVYGIVQALVISVSVRQSVILGEEEPQTEENGGGEEEEEEVVEEEEEDLRDRGDHAEMQRITKEGLCLG